MCISEEEVRDILRERRRGERRLPVDEQLGVYCELDAHDRSFGVVVGILALGMLMGAVLGFALAMYLVSRFA